MGLMHELPLRVVCRDGWMDGWRAITQTAHAPKTAAGLAEDTRLAATGSGGGMSKLRPAWDEGKMVLRAVQEAGAGHPLPSTSAVQGCLSLALTYYPEAQEQPEGGGSLFPARASTLTSAAAKAQPVLNAFLTNSTSLRRAAQRPRRSQSACNALQRVGTLHEGAPHATVPARQQCPLQQLLLAPTNPVPPLASQHGSGSCVSRRPRSLLDRLQPFQGQTPVTGRRWETTDVGSGEPAPSAPGGVKEGCLQGPDPGLGTVSAAPPRHGQELPGRDWHPQPVQCHSSSSSSGRASARSHLWLPLKTGGTEGPVMQRVQD